MADVAAGDGDGGLVLRVHGGRLHGAEQPLEPGVLVRVGHGFDNQLVLRGKGTNGVAFTLQLVEAGVRVQLLSGELSLLGCPLAAGGAAVLPLYVPLRFGEFAIAVGDPLSPRWAEVPVLVTTAAQPVPAAPVNDDEQGSPSRDVERWLGSEANALARRLSGNRRPAWMMAAAAALLAIVAVPFGTRAVQELSHSPDKLEQELALAGLPDLQVREDRATGSLTVTGRVANDAAVERVRALATEGYGAVTLDITTNAATALAINSLLEAEGVDAEARSDRSGIAVHTEYLPQDRLAAIQARIATDVPGAGPVRFLRDMERGPRDLQYFFASERFGLASLVDGDPGHIVTADGQYWFAGSLLPTGHRLLDVREGAIRFERNGLVETLRVAGPSSPPPAQDSEPSSTTASFITAKAG